MRQLAGKKTSEVLETSEVLGREDLRVLRELGGLVASLRRRDVTVTSQVTVTWFYGIFQVWLAPVLIQ